MQNKKNIMDRIEVINQKVKVSKDPRLILITRETNEGFNITEHYRHTNNRYTSKEYFYKDYNDYLNEFRQNKDSYTNTTIIIDDLPIVD